MPERPLQIVARPGQSPRHRADRPTGQRESHDELVARICELKAAAERDRTASARLLRVVSHDLRQPLQTLALLQGLLAKSVTGAGPQSLVERIGDTLTIMSGLLGKLLETNPDLDPARGVATHGTGAMPARRDAPEELAGLLEALHGLAPDPEGPSEPSASDPAQAGRSAGSLIFVIDDDRDVRHAICSVLEDDGRAVEAFETGEAFLEAFEPHEEACLLVDAYLPGMDGLEVLQRMARAGHTLPTIMITGQSDVPMAVEAMKAGACDFIEKPVSRSALLASVTRALAEGKDASKISAGREAAAKHVASLTPRQREIMTLVLAGHPSKNIAADLRISQRTVENHRASIMKRTGAESLPALARLAVAADLAHTAGLSIGGSAIA